MILRLFNILVIGALVLAAAYVYRIKFEASVQAERLAKLRDEVRQERDKIAGLRAEWGELDTPARIQVLAQRFLKLGPVVPTQFDSLAHLPAAPAVQQRSGNADAIGGIIARYGAPAGTAPTAAAPGAQPAPARAAAARRP